MADNQTLVIGLGRFGAATAGQLDRLGREVLAVDEDEALVQKWAERVTHAVVADARSIDALRQIGAQDFSIAVCAVGSSIEASVLITANLVDLKVPQIWAKAISASHGKILERIGANHVIYPEREAGERVAHLVSGRMLDFIRFDDDFVLAKMYPPKFIRGVGLNNDGAGKASFTAPSVQGQAECIRLALDDAGLPASAIGPAGACGPSRPRTHWVCASGSGSAWAPQASHSGKASCRPASPSPGTSRSR